MSDDTTRRDTQDHAEAIRRLTDRVSADISTIIHATDGTVPLGDHTDAAIDRLIEVDSHADAFATRCAEAEARAGRLQRALIQEAKIVITHDDEREPEYVPDDEAIHVLYQCNTELHDGDLTDGGD